MQSDGGESAAGNAAEGGHKPAAKTKLEVITMLKKVLRNHPYAQCHVRLYEDGSVDFISYTTRVITIQIINGKRFIECTGTYSMTTIKQIGWFLKEYAPDLCYYDMKRIAYKGVTEM